MRSSSSDVAIEANVMLKMVAVFILLFFIFWYRHSFENHRDLTKTIKKRNIFHWNITMMHHLVAGVLVVVLLQVSNIACLSPPGRSRFEQKTKTSSISQVAPYPETETRQFDNLIGLAVNPSLSRREDVLRTIAGVCFGFATAAGSRIDSSNALTSYSSNARNMERLNAGDASGGGVFDNNPRTESGRKRRAMTGCKNSVAREEASETVLNLSKTISEKDCNIRVLGGDSDFMLEALRNLDCPTCPYGISNSR